MVLLRSGSHRGIRELAVGAVVTLIWAWGVAHYPYLLPETLTIEAGAATSETLTMVFAVFGAAVVLVLPSFGLLYTLSLRNRLEGETGRSPPTGPRGE